MIAASSVSSRPVASALPTSSHRHARIVIKVLIAVRVVYTDSEGLALNAHVTDRKLACLFVI